MGYKSAAQILRDSKRTSSPKRTVITSIPTSHSRAGKVFVSTSGKKVPIVNPIRK